MTDKKEIGTLLSNTGSIMTDELRNMFGMAPCENEELGNTFVMSKNWGSAESVKDQVDKQLEGAKALADAEKQKEENLKI